VKIILASQSPRRRDLLCSAGIEHAVRAANLNETILPDESPVAYVRRLARDKAHAVARTEDEVILAADTTVVCDGRILGKPIDDSDAIRMLRLLSGQVHEVITGICLLYGSSLVLDHAVTRVWFHELREEEIHEYVQSGEPADKAGAYAIQGIASRYVERIDGSYSNVVGLPISLVWQALERIRSSLS
jgi:septum formation protein